MKKLNIKNILHLVTCLIFLGFIGIFTLTNLFAEKKSFSENENRVLTEFPSASFSNIFFGSFDTEFESWFSDHFIGRDGWIRTKASFLKTMGAIENNTVYFARDHRLIQQFIDYDEKLVESNISYINEFAEENGLKLNIMLVPGASQGEKKYLPLMAGGVDEAKLISKIGESFKDQNYIDVCGKLGTGENNYFRTDHHWNHLGAFDGYTAICQSVLNKEPADFFYTKVADDFRGTMYSKSGAFWTKGDEIYRMDPEKPFTVHVTYEDGTESLSLFVDSRLQEKDKYTYYLDGNHAHVTIKTDIPGNKKAVIIKDSFSHILIPYLCAEYSELEIYDLRYYREQISTSITDKENTDIYVIYGLETFCTDNSLAVLW